MPRTASKAAAAALRNLLASSFRPIAFAPRRDRIGVAPARQWPLTAMASNRRLSIAAQSPILC
jgi:hypothetical protein